jgi:hypothetical protein
MTENSRTDTPSLALGGTAHTAARGVEASSDEADR